MITVLCTSKTYETSCVPYRRTGVSPSPGCLFALTRNQNLVSNKTSVVVFSAVDAFHRHAIKNKSKTI